MAERTLGVGQTIAFSLRFSWQNLFLLLRLSWLPVAILVIAMIALFYGFGSAAFAEDEAFPTGPFAGANEGLLALGFVLLLVGSLAFVPAYVIVSRKAAGGYTPPSGVFAGFRFGGREWRVIGAFLLWYLLLSVAYFAIAFGLGLVFALGMVGLGEGATGGASAVLFGVVGALAGLIAVCALMFFVVRSMLFVPLAAIENRVAFGDAWRATKGNFWRLVAVGLVLYLAGLALYFAFAVVAGALFGSGNETVALVGGGLLVLLGAPAYLFYCLLFISYPAKAVAKLRPMSDEAAAEVFA